MKPSDVLDVWKMGRKELTFPVFRDYIRNQNFDKNEQVLKEFASRYGVFLSNNTGGERSVENKSVVGAGLMTGAALPHDDSLALPNQQKMDDKETEQHQGMMMNLHHGNMAADGDVTSDDIDNNPVVMSPRNYLDVRSTGSKSVGWGPSDVKTMETAKINWSPPMPHSPRPESDASVVGSPNEYYRSNTMIRSPDRGDESSSSVGMTASPHSIGLSGTTTAKAAAALSKIQFKPLVISSKRYKYHADDKSTRFGSIAQKLQRGESVSSLHRIQQEEEEQKELPTALNSSPSSPPAINPQAFRKRFHAQAQAQQRISMQQQEEHEQQHHQLDSSDEVHIPLSSSPTLSSSMRGDHKHGNQRNLRLLSQISEGCEENSKQEKHNNQLKGIALSSSLDDGDDDVEIVAANGETRARRRRRSERRKEKEMLDQQIQRLVNKRDEMLEQQIQRLVNSNTTITTTSSSGRSRSSSKEIMEQQIQRLVSLTATSTTNSNNNNNNNKVVKERTTTMDHSSTSLHMPKVQ
eukprot:jgi/Bigna1/146556/aug1.116_g21264